MNQWIEINLPWRVSLPHPKMPEFPDLSTKVKSHFGYTLTELEERFFPKSEYDDGDRVLDHPIFIEYEKVRDLLEGEGFNGEELKNKLEAHPDWHVKQVMKWKRIKQELIDWEDEQPEMLAAIREDNRLSAEYQEQEAKMSFSRSGLAKAGTVIEIEDSGGKISQMMIGNINEQGGVCDDCRGIEDNAMVKRYLIVWSA